MTVISGRCYFGATTICTTQKPLAIAYCHCIDCRRATGAPVAVFAAFNEAAVTFTPNALKFIVMPAKAGIQGPRGEAVGG
jgi:hypothetical protein